MMKQGSDKFDIVIVGGGVIGVILALTLYKHAKLFGWKIALVERRSIKLGKLPPETGRAFWISATTRTLLKHIGIWDEILPKTCFVGEISMSGNWPGRGVSISENDRGEINKKQLNDNAVGYMVSERVLTAALLNKLLGVAQHRDFSIINDENNNIESGSLSIIDESEITTAPKNDNIYSTINLTHKGSEYAIKTSLILACDGINSKLREYANIKVSQRDYKQRNLVALLQLPKPHMGICRQTMLLSGPIALLPLGDDQASLAWTLPAEQALEIQQLDIAEQQEKLNEVLENSEEKVRLITAMKGFDLQRKLAKSIYADRLALVGDAARVIHPLLGQGFNWGVRDIISLSDELYQASLIGMDIGDNEILRKYEISRGFDNWSITGVTDSMINLFCTNQSIASLAGAGVSFATKLEIVKRGMINQADGPLIM